MTENIKNPFTPTFGSIPLMLAGRKEVMNNILAGLDNGPGDPNRATIFVGARGTGKTVLLAKIAEEASARGWISANVNANPGMLDEIIIQIKDNAKEFLAPESLSYITSIGLGSFSISRSTKASARKSTWRSELTAIIKELNEKGVGLLITVDEVNIETEEMSSLVVAFQHFVRERREVALIMAGLPQKVSDLLRDDSISFLRRAFQHHLNPIEESEVRYSLKKTIEFSGRKIENIALDLAAKKTEGFPFLIQLIGYQMWRQNPGRKQITFEDAVEGVVAAQVDLERMVFARTYRDLSDKDLAFINAMLDDSEYSKMSDIAERLNVSTKFASVYRKRLIEQGIIGSRGHGKVAFDLPMFKEYLQNRLE